MNDGLQKFDGCIKPEHTDEQTNKQRHTSTFQWRFWLILLIENWIFDFGRPIAMSFVPIEWSPLSLPNVGDVFHMLYNILTPIVLMKLINRTSRKISNTFVQVLVIIFVMGASIHLVADSVNHRLTHSGYQLHLSVQENPIMKNLTPKTLIHSFELLYFYDEVFGHLMWYLPYFAMLLIYFNASFTSSEKYNDLGAGGWILSACSALYYWYLVTEGQIFPLFVATVMIMTAIISIRYRYGNYMDVNASFLYNTFMLTLILVCFWVAYLWNDHSLRVKYDGFIYVPEPWSYYSLYYAHKH